MLSSSMENGWAQKHSDLRAWGFEVFAQTSTKYLYCEPLRSEMFQHPTLLQCHVDAQNVQISGPVGCFEMEKSRISAIISFQNKRTDSARLHSLFRNTAVYTEGIYIPHQESELEGKEDIKSTTCHVKRRWEF